jgi:hypothetical protein
VLQRTITEALPADLGRNRDLVAIILAYIPEWEWHIDSDGNFVSSRGRNLPTWFLCISWISEEPRFKTHIPPPNTTPAVGTVGRKKNPSVHSRKKNPSVHQVAYEGALSVVAAFNFFYNPMDICHFLATHKPRVGNEDVLALVGRALRCRHEQNLTAEVLLESLAASSRVLLIPEHDTLFRLLRMTPQASITLSHPEFRKEVSS